MTITKPKLSNERLIISGDVIEHFQYERPYIYNTSGRPPAERTGQREKRKDNLARVRSEIRRLVECNHSRYGYEPVFLTFTYRRNETNVATANRDWTHFIERLNVYYKKKHHYLAVVEFQKRGAVHYHCIFFNIEPGVEDSERCGTQGCMAFELGNCNHGNHRRLAILWGHGYVDIERIRSAKNVGAYVCKYLNKAVTDPRLIGKKCYMTSHALLRPREYRNKTDIDRILLRGKLVVERKVEYESTHYKKVIITTYGNSRSDS